MSSLRDPHPRRVLRDLMGAWGEAQGLESTEPGRGTLTSWGMGVREGFLKELYTAHAAS